METIKNYLDSMFANLPNTASVLRAKEELLQMMEDKYTELIKDGKSENEAVGNVIAEFGNLSELAEKLSRTYAVKFHFNTTEHLEDEFSISLRNNETLSDVLNALERIIPVKIRVDGENVYINKK